MDSLPLILNALDLKKWV